MKKNEYKEQKKIFKNSQNALKNRYKSKRPVFKARVKKFAKKIANKLHKENIKTFYSNRCIAYETWENKYIVNRIKDFVNTRQNYIELKKKWNYLVSSITVLGAAGSDKDVRKEIDDIVDFLNNEPELAKEKLDLIE